MILKIYHTLLVVIQSWGHNSKHCNFIVKKLTLYLLKIKIFAQLWIFLSNEDLVWWRILVAWFSSLKSADLTIDITQQIFMRQILSWSLHYAGIKILERTNFSVYIIITFCVCEGACELAMPAELQGCGQRRWSCLLNCKSGPKEQPLAGLRGHTIGLHIC